jgi:hypothetical protein
MVRPSGLVDTSEFCQDQCMQPRVLPFCLLTAGILAAAPATAEESSVRLAESEAETIALRSTLTAYERTIAVRTLAFPRFPIAVTFFRVPSIAEETLGFPRLPDLSPSVAFERVEMGEPEEDFPHLPSGPLIERVSLDDQPEPETAADELSWPDLEQTSKPAIRPTRVAAAVTLTAGLATMFGGMLAAPQGEGHGFVVGGTVLSMSGFGLMLLDGPEEETVRPTGESIASTK